eukprot:m.234594 g.234594  ORF g.234594 m.234594 type:complete len:1946 (-) comp33657_c0_seq1:271-6108(-)
MPMPMPTMPTPPTAMPESPTVSDFIAPIKRRESFWLKAQSQLIEETSDPKLFLFIQHHKIENLVKLKRLEEMMKKHFTTDDWVEEIHNKLVLFADNTGIGNVAKLSNALTLKPTVVVLKLNNNEIEDFTPLLAAKKGESMLRRIELKRNIITANVEIFLSQSLCELILSENKITDVESIAAALTSNNTLQELDLSGNKITKLAPISKVLKTNTGLKRLTLDLNPINDAESIFECLRVNTGLSVLKLDDIAAGQNLNKLAAALYVNNSLTELCYRNNGLEDFSLVGEALGKNKGLQRLWIQHNFIEDISNFARSLAKNNTLLMVGLDSNKIHSVECFRYPLSVNKTLVLLGLQSNRIVDVEPLAAALCKNTAMKTFTFASNHITDISAFGKTLEQNNTLELLKFQNNKIQNISRVAQGLAKNRKLAQLWLENNSIRRIDPFIEVLENGGNDVIRHITLQRNHASCTKLMSRLNKVLQINQQRHTQKLVASKEKDDATIQHAINALASDSITLNLSRKGLFHTGALSQGITCSVDELRMGSNEIIDVSPIAEFLCTSKSVTRVELTGNAISDLSALESTISKNNSLLVLGLQRNDICNISPICQGLINNLYTAVCELRFGNNRIDNVELLGKALEQNTSIKVLFLNDNVIDDIAPLGKALLSNVTLVDLRLASNRISKGIDELGRGIEANVSLRRLDLNKNQITDITAIARGLQNNKEDSQLKRIQLNNNRVTFLAPECVALLEDDMIVSMLHQDVTFEWPPSKIIDICTRDKSTQALKNFLFETSKSSSPLSRSRIMFVGHGGSGKTTLKHALCLSNPASKASERLLPKLAQSLRATMLDWSENDVMRWFDDDVAFDGFFESIPGLSGVDGEMILLWTPSQIDFIFQHNTKLELNKRFLAVQKLRRVLKFVSVENISRLLASSRQGSLLDMETSPPTLAESWFCDEDFVRSKNTNTKNHNAHTYANNSTDSHHTSNTNNNDTIGNNNNKHLLHTHKSSLYEVLLDLPKQWTSGIDIGTWDGFTLWDFAGQLELFPTHHLFLGCSTTIYLLVMDVSRGHAMCQRQASFWCQRLRDTLPKGFTGEGLSTNRKLKVRVVATHTDVGSCLDKFWNNIFVDLTKRFANTIEFGDKVYTTKYRRSTGGDVGALVSELEALKVPMERMLVPDSYRAIQQQVLDLADSRRDYPVVAADEIDFLGLPKEAALLFLEETAYVKRARIRPSTTINEFEVLVLNPVEWLSKLTDPFVHPVYGLRRMIKQSLTVDDIVAGQAVTIDVACDAIKKTHPEMIPDGFREEILLLLQACDVCFALPRTDKFIFPSMLTSQDRSISSAHIKKAMQWNLGDADVCARRFQLEDAYESIPPSGFCAILREVMRIVEALDGVIAYLTVDTIIVQTTSVDFVLHFVAESQAQPIPFGIDIACHGARGHEMMHLLSLKMATLTENLCTGCSFLKMYLFPGGESGVDHPVFGSVKPVTAPTEVLQRAVLTRRQSADPIERMYRSAWNVSGMLDENNEIKNPRRISLVTDPSVVTEQQVQGSRIWVELDRESIKLNEVLGQGNFGQVYSGTYTSAGSILAYEVAVKTLKDKSELRRAEFMHEIRVMAQLSHGGRSENVAALIGAVVEDTPILMVIQLCSKGSLLDQLKRQTDIKMLVLMDILLGVCAGMKFVAGLHFVHRDLSARNILINSSSTPVVADFGLSQKMTLIEHEYVYNETDEEAKFALLWMSPQALSERVFTEKSDIWSFGILAIETLSQGKAPYSDLGTKLSGDSNGDDKTIPALLSGSPTAMEVVRAVVEDEFVHPFPNDLPLILHERFIKLCLSYDEVDRPTFQQTEDILTKLKTDLRTELRQTISVQLIEFEGIACTPLEMQIIDSIRDDDDRQDAFDVLQQARESVHQGETFTQFEKYPFGESFVLLSECEYSALTGLSNRDQRASFFKVAEDRGHFC